MEQALWAVRQGLALDPEHAGLHWNQALIHLMRNEFEVGFKGYEWRYLRSSKQRPEWMARLWDGQATSGVVELHTEQGFGDALQFLGLSIGSNPWLGSWYFGYTPDDGHSVRIKRCLQSGFERRTIDTE